MCYAVPGWREEVTMRHVTASRLVRGEAHPKAVLTDDLVRRIRREYGGGRAVHAIAIDLGVSWRTVRRVLDGTTWKHVR